MKGDKVNNKQKPIFVQRAADTRRSYETLNFDYAIAAKLCQHFVFFFSLSLMYVVSFRVCRSLLVDLLSLPFAMAFERRKIHRAFFFLLLSAMHRSIYSLTRFSSFLARIWACKAFSFSVSLVCYSFVVACGFRFGSMIQTKLRGSFTGDLRETVYGSKFYEVVIFEFGMTWYSQ